MIYQKEFRLKARRRGCHLITGEILAHLPSPLPEAGLLNIFVKHTSCGLTVNENADPDVRADMNRIFDRLVPENQPYYEHTMEGADDMPAHAKSTLAGVSLTIPVSGGRLNLGTWQGIYLCEFRDYGGERSIVLTLYS
ncbi:MAG: secondary thiamine-phosphate synthase enzyme YjbQ [Muribaculaceae bacterium]|nr:secondary thiamine-phosphate synthase enzyme YjbQ [Muribaculaceae bacterium]